MRLNHIESIAIVCTNLETGITQYCADSSHAIHTRMPESRALALGAAKLKNARCALIRGVELIEFSDARCGLADDGANAVVASDIGLGWAWFERIDGAISPMVALLNARDGALSAAFYLGLGAESVSATADAYLVNLSAHASLKIMTSKRTFVGVGNSPSLAPSMSGDSPRAGIFCVRIARIGTRGQTGPYRVLRGLDGELIELG